MMPWLTGAGVRSVQGTSTGHENGEAMASVSARVEPPVTPHAGEGLKDILRVHAHKWG